MKHAVCWFSLAILTLVAVADDGAAQSSQGLLRGVATDAKGLVAGATVTLVNESTGVSRQTQTNDEGTFLFEALNPSIYTLKAVRAGHRSAEWRGVRVGAHQAVRLDIVLEIGEGDQPLAISGQSQLQSLNPSPEDVLDSAYLASLPTPGRSILAFGNLEPTVDFTEGYGRNRLEDEVGDSGTVIGGGPKRGNAYLLDGFSITNLQNSPIVNPSLEAVGEMNVQRHDYKGDAGRTAGGVFNLATSSGTNRFHAAAYGMAHPKALSSELLMAKFRSEPKVGERWIDGGGSAGGPIVRNKTFFWVAGEKYVDDRPQHGSFLIPTMAERSGDFSGLTRGGVLQVITDPLTGRPFPGNVIPASRINAVGRAIMSYFPTASACAGGSCRFDQVDNGSSNFGMTDLASSRADQLTARIDHQVDSRRALSLFGLRQQAHVTAPSYNPVNRFVGGDNTDQLTEAFVVNGTDALGSYTVLSARAGWNQFDDNKSLPFAFNASSLWPANTAFTSQMSDTNRFPSTDNGAYQSTGFSDRQTNRYYQWGVNGGISTARGRHEIAVGGDYRIVGARSLDFGASTGSYTFSGGYTGNEMADMLLGYPQQRSQITVNTTPLDGFVKYYAAYFQDDWRVDKFTLSLGLRVSHETGLRERNNRIAVNFVANLVNTLSSEVLLVDPLTLQPRSVGGGLLFADVTDEYVGRQPQFQPEPRVGIAYAPSDSTVVRAGWGLFYSPWSYPPAGTNAWGQNGYSATTQVPQPTGGAPTVTMSDPFPAGLVAPSGNTLGTVTGVGGDIYFIDPNRGAPHYHLYSAQLEHELRGVVLGIGYTGSHGIDLSWAGGDSRTTLININQLDPKYMRVVGDTTKQVANPFYGIADAGQFATQKTISIGQLLRPYPQFGNVYEMQTTGAHSWYNAGTVEIRKRLSGLWGGRISYTYSRLEDNQIGGSNYYSRAPGLQNIYSIFESSNYFNPNAEYGLSLLDSPHKLVVAPTLMLPFGEGRALFSNSGTAAALFGGWTVSALVTVQSGFPIAVTQDVRGTTFLMGGTPRPNLVSGVNPLVPGNVTDRLTASVTDNLYLNPAAFAKAGVAQNGDALGNAPRTLPGVRSPWRNNVDLLVSKSIGIGAVSNAVVRLEILNLMNAAQWAGPSSLALGRSDFGQETTQVNNPRTVQLSLRLQF